MSVLDLSPKARRVFLVGFFLLQGLLVATAWERPDRIFGFQMFNESSSLRFELLRKVEQRKVERRSRSSAGPRLRQVRVEGGSWQERLRDGSSRTVEFGERVRYAALRDPGVFKHATYGSEAQVFRLQRALEDMLMHLPAGSETRELGARVEVLKNGRAIEPFEIWSRRP